jgi:hypothetical protein
LQVGFTWTQCVGRLDIGVMGDEDHIDVGRGVPRDIGCLIDGVVAGRPSSGPAKEFQVAFRPEFTRHKTAAAFKRNDQLLGVLPIGVVVFSGSGISDNLADKTRKLGIPLFDFRKGGGA